MDPIQTLFSEHNELVELFARHGDQLSHEWSGEVDPTGKFSYVITYKYWGYSPITKVMYFKYLPVIEQNYRIVMMQHRDESYELTPQSNDGVTFVYGQSKVYNEQGELRSEDSLLYHDRDVYATGILSWGLFEKLVQQIRDERVELDNADPVYDKFRYCDHDNKVSKLLIDKYLGLYPGNMRVSVHDGNHSRFLHFESYNEFQDSYMRNNYGSSYGYGGNNYGSSNYRNGNYRSRYDSITGDRQREPNIKVVLDLAPYSCCVEVSDMYGSTKTIRVQFIHKLNCEMFNKVIKQSKLVSMNDVYIVVYRDVIDITDEQTNELRRHVNLYTEDKFMSSIRY